MTVLIRPMLANDALAIQRQASQRVQLGIERDMTLEEADALIEGGEAWTAELDGRVVACMGLRETFEGVQAVAWAVLAESVGPAHLTVTRFARRRIAASGLKRIEAIVRAAVPAECAWARLVGLRAAHVLRNFGAQSETHVLYERIA